MGLLIGTVLTLFILSSLFLVILIVVFQSKGGASGLNLTGGASQTPFGSSSADVITKVTRYTALSFIALSLILSFLFAEKQESILPPEGSIVPDNKAPSVSTSTSTDSKPITPESTDKKVDTGVNTSKNNSTNTNPPQNPNDKK